MAAGEMCQSMSFFAASIFFEVLRIPLASTSQPIPSRGTIRSSGAPFCFRRAPRKANEIPIGTSPAAMKVYNEYLPILAIPEIAVPVEHFPTDTVGKMIGNDFGWAADNRKRILGEWQKRYDTKSEPKG